MLTTTCNLCILIFLFLSLTGNVVNGETTSSANNDAALAAAMVARQRWELRGNSPPSSGKATTAVVTGGTKGIGKAIVEELAHKGCRVLTCSRNSDELKNCITEWHSLGLDVDGVVADISTADGRQTLVNEIYEWLSENKDTMGVKDDDDGSRKKRKKKKINQKKNSEQLQLDILVNNVGTNIRKPTIEYTQEEILKVFDTNFFSMYALTIACHPLLKRTPKQMKDLSSTGGSKRSSVVNIGSVAGVTCMKSGSPYASTKAAMNQLTGNLVRTTP